jgi:hypothetical protein
MFVGSRPDSVGFRDDSVVAAFDAIYVYPINIAATPASTFDGLRQFATFHIRCVLGAPYKLRGTRRVEGGKRVSPQPFAEAWTFTRAALRNSLKSWMHNIYPPSL